MSINTTSMSISELVEALNAENNVAAADKFLAALNEGIKAENKATIASAVESFVKSAEASPVDFFRSFIADPFVKVKRVKKDNKSGEYSLVDAVRQISFAEVENAYGNAHKGQTLAQSKRYVGMIAHFTHNLHANLCGALSEEGQKVTVKKFNGQQVEEYDFTGTSIGKLQTQLNAIVSTILPEGMTIQMVKADVRAIMAAHQTEKFMEFTTAAEKKVLNQIFGAMRIRMAGNAYVVNSKAACHKAKESNQTPAQEERTSKIPERAEAEQTLSPESATKTTNAA